jgi:hypothetical protein
MRGATIVAVVVAVWPSLIRIYSAAMVRRGGLLFNRPRDDVGIFYVVLDADAIALAWVCRSRSSLKILAAVLPPFNVLDATIRTVCIHTS